MRKLIFQMLVSLDGYFEGPNGELDWHRADSEFNDYAIDMLNTVDTLLFGRATYKLMASYWPTETALSDDPVVAGKMNTLPKIVFSHTLDTVTWKNSRLVKGNAIEEICQQKQQQGKDMLIIGSNRLAQSCMQAGLIDEYRIMVSPVVLGAGNTLFRNISTRQALQLSRTRRFDSGMVLLYYQPMHKSQHHAFTRG
jgi:dihydrofolate reductase